MVADAVEAAVALLVTGQEGDDAFGFQEEILSDVFVEHVGDGAGEGLGLGPGELVGQSEVVAPGEHEEAVAVLGHGSEGGVDADVTGVEHHPRRVVAEPLHGVAPLAEVGGVLLVDECGDVLLQQQSGAQAADGFLGVPQHGGACAAVLLDACPLAGLRNVGTGCRVSQQVDFPILYIIFPDDFLPVDFGHVAQVAVGGIGEAGVVGHYGGLSVEGSLRLGVELCPRHELAVHRGQSALHGPAAKHVEGHCL